MERRKGKHILYSICFICFALIDWCRGSQNWMNWATMNNLTGVFMSLLMMSHFRWKEESKKPYLIWLALWLAGSMTGYVIWYMTPWAIFETQYWTGAVSVCFVGIVALRVFRERKQLEVRFSGFPVLVLSFLVMSLLMSFSPMGEIWPAWYFVLFGLFYLIPYSAEERRELWKGMADGQIIAFFILQIIAYGFRPYDEVRYEGMYVNCNMNALFYLLTYIALLYRSHVLRWQEKREGVMITRKRMLAKIFLRILTAGIWGFVLLTMTRTAMIMLVVLTALYGVVEFVVLYRESPWKIYLRTFNLVLGAIVLFPMVYLTVRWLPTILHHPIWFGGDYSINKVHSFDPADSEKYVSWEEVLEELLGRMGVGLLYTSSQPDTPETEMPLLASTQVTAEMLQSSDRVVWQEELLEGNDRKNSGKVRLQIWKLYLKNMNLTGHELEDGYFQITPGYHAWHAQNVFLQVGFYYGAIAGVLLIVLTVGVGLQAVKLIPRKSRCEDILPLLIGLLFVAYGMSESVWYPGQMILLLIYMIPKIIIDHQRDAGRKV